MSVQFQKPLVLLEWQARHQRGSRCVRAGQALRSSRREIDTERMTCEEKPKSQIKCLNSRARHFLSQLIYRFHLKLQYKCLTSISQSYNRS